MPKPVHSHPVSTPGELFQHGAEANTHLNNALQSFAASRGGLHVPAPPASNHPDRAAWDAHRVNALAHTGVSTFAGPMKKPERVAQKIEEDRARDDKTDLSNVLDIGRSTVTADKHADFHQLLPHFREHMATHGFSLARVKDKYQQPQAADTGAC